MTGGPCLAGLFLHGWLSGERCDAMGWPARVDVAAAAAHEAWTDVSGVRGPAQAQPPGPGSFFQLSGCCDILLLVSSSAFQPSAGGMVVLRLIISRTCNNSDVN